MKILMVASFAESLINFRGALIAEFQRHGYQVHVTAPDLFEGCAVRQAIEARGVIVHNLSMRRAGLNPFKDLNTLLQLILLIKQVHPEIVLTYTIKPVIYGTFAAWVTGVKKRIVLITGLGYAFTDSSGFMRMAIRSLTRIMYSVALLCAHKIFFQNPDDRDLFIRLGIVKDSSAIIVVNGSGVDISYFSDVPVESKKITFLLISRLIGDKGIREYVLAAKRLKECYRDIHFELAGWIDENPDAIGQDELDGWINDGIITFLGKLEDVRPAILRSTVYVLPSYREGMPRTVLEAMSMGRPIITTDAPGCRETVVDGQNGFLVPVKDAVLLALAMEKFIQIPGLANKMGAQSRLIAVRKYDVKLINEVMLSEMGIYEKNY